MNFIIVFLFMIVSYFKFWLLKYVLEEVGVVIIVVLEI